MDIGSHIMPSGTCRLCQREAELQLSHVVPAFVFRWMRESSGNSFLRSTQSPNLRVQDGPQKHWLCLDCEARLGRAETAFATELFHPYLEESGRRFPYGPWLLRFCVSISWRNLAIQLESLDPQKLDEQEWTIVNQAEFAWRQFLLEETPNPGKFRQFVLPMDRIEGSGSALPSNMNRYLMRSIDLDFCHDDQAIFTYTKLGRFVIVGFVHEPEASRWNGGKVNANRGAIEPRDYTVPAPFWRYLMNRASNSQQAMQGVSPKQAAKIEQAFRANADQIVGSDFFNAMQADVEMFGSAAFTRQVGDSER
ncbi:conserved hypothetical protein [Stenotrophomonas maltophilia]|nr:conserved hypothetical protein [Stenotrophomonas maltophilia]